MTIAVIFSCRRSMSPCPRSELQLTRAFSQKPRTYMYTFHFLRTRANTPLPRGSVRGRAPAQLRFECNLSSLFHIDWTFPPHRPLSGVVTLSGHLPHFVLHDPRLVCFTNKAKNTDMKVRSSGIPGVSGKSELATPPGADVVLAPRPL